MTRTPQNPEPADAEARRAVEPVTCYPVEQLPPFDAALYERARAGMTQIDEVIIPPRDARPPPTVGASQRHSSPLPSSADSDGDCALAGGRFRAGGRVPPLAHRAAGCPLLARQRRGSGGAALEPPPDPRT